MTSLATKLEKKNWCVLCGVVCIRSQSHSLSSLKRTLQHKKHLDSPLQVRQDQAQCCCCAKTLCSSPSAVHSARRDRRVAASPSPQLFPLFFGVGSLARSTCAALVATRLHSALTIIAFASLLFWNVAIEQALYLSTTLAICFLVDCQCTAHLEAVHSQSAQ